MFERKRELIIDDYVSREDLGEDCVQDCSSSGDCEDACRYWMDFLGVEFTDVPLLRAYLNAYDGEWGNFATPDEDICIAAFWLMCGDLSDNPDDPDFLFCH